MVARERCFVAGKGSLSAIVSFWITYSAEAFYVVLPAVSLPIFSVFTQVLFSVSYSPHALLNDSVEGLSIFFRIVRLFISFSTDITVEIIWLSRFPFRAVLPYEGIC
jgi:hypothetical protein